MVGTRDTPADLQDAPDYSNIVREAKDYTKSVLQSTKDTDFIKTLARQAYDSSTNWLNAGRRLAWNDSLRAFQNMHPNGSKYLSGDYRYRSKLFRPKTRTMVRQAEAGTAAAFFSNEDVVSIMAANPDNMGQVASAEILKELLQYRLTNTIPWFLTVVGARQDAEVMGICIGKAYWRYKEQFSHTEKTAILHPEFGHVMLDDDGMPLFDHVDVMQTVEDKPWIDLLAPENFRFDPGADWRRPVETSPYTIELIPMYMCDIKERIKTGEWNQVSDSSIRSATDLDDDVTRRSREPGRVPGKDHDAWKPSEYDICWVRENILRIDGEDMHCYTLASAGELLSEPKPLKEVYLSGERPYVAGFVMPEAHKTYTTSKVELVKDLQTYVNDVTNLRLDNVKLTINPRQFVRSGKGLDLYDLRTFQPGKTVVMQDPAGDIVWDRPPDVTASSYQEQDRINLDFDELTGGISNSSIQSNKQIYEAVGNMQMMAGNASQIGEYEQRVFAETFVEPILKKLVKLEQAYETDPIVLSIAGSNAQLSMKYGINEVTDELLNQEVTTRVNAGTGSTNPQMKLKNFLQALQALGQIYGPMAAMASNPKEVVKEIFGLSGYKDGERFLNPNQDLNKLMQQAMQPKPQQKAATDPTKMPIAQMKMQEAQMKMQSDKQIAMLDYQKTAMQEAEETKRVGLNHQHDLVVNSLQQPNVHPALRALLHKQGIPNV